MLETFQFKKQNVKHLPSSPFQSKIYSETVLKKKNKLAE